MAQQDTGLGWSAKEDWLIQSAGSIVATLRKFGGTSFPGQPIPQTDRPSSNLYAYGIPLTTTTESYYFSASIGTEALMFFVTQQSDMHLVFVSAEPGGTIYRTYRFANGNYFPDPAGIENISGVDSGTGLYYFRFPTGSISLSNLNPFIPTFATEAEGFAAIEVANIPLTKTNAGYSVDCVVRWKTANGTELISPILISSNSTYADMTTTATGYNFAKYEQLLSGVRFYMGFWDIPGSENLVDTGQTLDLTDRGPMSLDQLFMTIISTANAHVIIITSPDPYEEEGAGSGEEGGDGEDLEDDEMGISHHAIPAAINTGFCRIYCPTEQQLRDLSNFLWSAQYDLTAVKKLFANPMDSVLGLSAVPLNLSGANAAVYLGGVDTEMSFPMVSYQSYQIPMGAITVEKRWGSYLDYDPYTRFSIFLPFIGFKDLSADDIMGKQIILDYDVDILSGACTARLQAGGNVLYQWSGQCSIQLPVTASNWNQVFQGATSAALSAGLAVATGSAGPVLAGALAAEGVQAIMGKPRIERGGTASGAAGWMGGLTPYLVRVTPEAIIPSDQNKFIGYPAFSSISLGSLTGYNEISSIHLEGIPATGAELDELEAILKGGVIF